MEDLTTKNPNGTKVLKIMGEKLMKDLIFHDPNVGGTLAMATGEQGSGKTSLLLYLAEAEMANGEIVIWRGREVAQWYRLKNWKHRVKLFIYEEDQPKFYRVEDETAKEIHIPYETYKEPRDILLKLEKGKLNVIYEPMFYTVSDEVKDAVYYSTGYKLKRNFPKGAYFWFDLFYALTTRLDRRFITLIIDEADDVFPQNPSGDLWKLQEWFKDLLKDARKSLISVFAAVHNLNDIDYRILGKFQAYIYLKGSKPFKGSMVNPKFILKLQKGYGVIEWGGFGLFKFPAYPPRNYGLLVRRQSLASHSPDG